MLILSRMKNEWIDVDPDIEILVTDVDIRPCKARVRLGINAPRHIVVRRREVPVVRQKQAEADRAFLPYVTAQLRRLEESLVRLDLPAAETDRCRDLCIRLGQWIRQAAANLGGRR